MARVLGFNPCFIGLASATVRHNEHIDEAWEFQSLFYWISLCDNFDVFASPYKIRSFNPCFIGLASATLLLLYLYLEVL